MDAKATKITAEMKLVAALALASSIPNPSAERILSEVFDRSVHKKVAEAVELGVVRKD